MNVYTKDALSILVRKNIRKYRLKSRLTLQELADKSNLSHGYMRDLESFKLNKTPTLEALGKISFALNINVKDLFDDIDEK